MERGLKNFPLIGFRKPDDMEAEGAEKAVDGESSEPAKADDPEMPRKSPRERLRVRVDDKNRLDGKEMLAGLLIVSC